MRWSGGFEIKICPLFGEEEGEIREKLVSNNCMFQIQLDEADFMGALEPQTRKPPPHSGLTHHMTAVSVTLKTTTPSAVDTEVICYIKNK